MNSRLYSIFAGDVGSWRIKSSTAIVGDGLASATYLTVTSEATVPFDPVWVLRGITSNERYITKEEKNTLVSKQEGLGRATSKCAALIPIKKSSDWWNLPQDERRRIFEEQSDHVKIGLRFLPAIARRLHHCRDLGPDEPFDFLTWFEYAPSESEAFEDLVAQLRASPEWKFVSREVDIRLERLTA